MDAPLSKSFEEVDRVIEEVRRRHPDLNKTQIRNLMVLDGW